MRTWRFRLGILTGSHFFNDMFNGLLIAILPLLGIVYHLSYTQVAVLILVNGVTAGLFQPLVARLMENAQGPWVLLISPLLLAGGCTSFSITGNFLWLITTMAVASLGSSLFHPEANRSVYLLKDTNNGMIQSTFQVGGNLGMACAPLGLWYLNRFSLHASWAFLCVAFLVSLCTLPLVRNTERQMPRRTERQRTSGGGLKSSIKAIRLLVAVVTCRALVNSGVVSFLPLYLLKTDKISETNIWVVSLLFLAGGALGTWGGGVLHSKLEERKMIQISLLVSAPLAFVALNAQGAGLAVCLFLFGLALMSTFSVTVLYAQKLMPGRAGLASSMVIGFTSGISGVVTVVLGMFADRIGIVDILYVFFSLTLIGWGLSLRLRGLPSQALVETPQT